MSVDMTRYSRQILFSPIGTAGQEKLQKSRVAIVGLGALGTALANHMARAGVGYLRLIDRDFVEASNLQRQMLYDEADAEAQLPKATAAADKLRAINSSVTLDPHVTDLTWRNAEELLTGVDLILDGTDNFDVRYLINDISVKHSVPWVYGGAVSARGMTFTIRPGITPCLRCLFPHPPAPGVSETCDTAGVIGPIVQVVAAYQATEAFKLLVGATDHLETRLRHFELWMNHDTAMEVSGHRREDCPACVERRFEYLDPEDKQAKEVSLCGRETVQITPPDPDQIDLDHLEKRLQTVAKVERNPFMLRVQLDAHRLVIFPDGRILVQGTSEIPLAKSIVARYIGV
ncbi:ThiF family adenylyltransferase [Lihuaxuella thermophila]